MAARLTVGAWQASRLIRKSLPAPRQSLGWNAPEGSVESVTSPSELAWRRRRREHHVTGFLRVQRPLPDRRTRGTFRLTMSR